MNKKKLAHNSFLNIIKTLATYIFPLITFMYASRVFLSDGMGRINFAQSYTAYFCLLGMLGIEKYGIREISGLRENREQLSHFAHELMLLNAVAVLTAYAAFFLSMLLVPRLRDYRILLLINSISIAFTAMGMNWLYIGVEDYKYITIRSLIVNAVMFAALFLLVHGPEDIYIFALLQTIASTGANIFNLIHSRKYVSYRRIGVYRPMRHLKPVLLLFGMTLFTEVFTHLDTTMLGFLSGDHATGLYVAAHKINGLFTAVITAAIMVLMPRISYHVKQNENEKVVELSQSTFNTALMLCIPVAVGVVCLSRQMVVFLSGESFAEASFTAKILAGRVLLSSPNAFFTLILFIPMGKERNNLVSTGIAAVLNLILNALLIPIFAQNGAAIGTVVAEAVEFAVNVWFLRKIFPASLLFRNVAQYVLAAVPVAVTCFFCSRLIGGTIPTLILSAILSVVLYFSVLIALKNEYIMPIVRKLKR